MSQDLLTIGEFARLAETTKRTVLWYEEKGILMPKTTDSSNGYREYEINQVIDFKALLLLRKLNFSIEEIKNFLAKQSSLEAIFQLKKTALRQQIANLQLALNDTETYYSNLRATSTLVCPSVKVINSFSVYYLDKRGPYPEIGSYFKELAQLFSNIPKNIVGAVLYEDTGYRPKDAKTKVCFIAKPGLRPKAGTEKLIQKMTVPSFKALSYTHHGSTKLLSMLWQELKKYRVKNGYEENKTLPFEDVELSQNEHITEMLMPIK